MTISDLKTIKYLLHNYYHQDVWVDSKTNEDVWNDFLKEETSDYVKRLREDVKTLLSQDNQDVHKFIRDENNGGLWFDNPEQTLSWLHNLGKYIEAK